MAVALNLEEHAPTSPGGPTPHPGLQIQEVKGGWEFAFLSRTQVMLTLIIWVPQLPWSEITGLAESHTFWARPDIPCSSFSSCFPLYAESGHLHRVFLEGRYYTCFPCSPSAPLSSWSYVLLFGYLVLWTSVLVQEMVCTFHKHLLLTPLSKELSREVIGKDLKVSVAQSCPALCHPMDCSPPGSSVHGDSPGKNTGVDCHSLLQGIFPTQGLNLGLQHRRQILYHLSHRGRPGKGLDDSK